MNAPVTHSWSRSERRQAEHDFKTMIEKYFGEVWNIPSDGEYLGKSWDCRSPIAVDAGLWRLCQAVKHAGGTRAAGKIELREAGTLMRFIVFYNPKEAVKQNRILDVF